MGAACEGEREVGAGAVSWHSALRFRSAASHELLVLSGSCASVVDLLKISTEQEKPLRH
jgi:hypothetical protein